MVIERTRDMATVRAIVTHPRLYRHMGDDFSPPRPEWRPIPDAQIYYLLAKDEGGALGAFMFLPENAVCFQVHVALLPRAWGVTSRVALFKAIDWMFAQSPCRRIVASIPASNQLAAKLARDVGMVNFGLNARSVLRGGRLEDQALFGISKAEG